MKKFSIYLAVLAMLSFSGCGSADRKSKERGLADYTAFLSDLYKNKSSNEELYFSVKDLDNNGSRI